MRNTRIIIQLIYSIYIYSIKYSRYPFKHHELNYKKILVNKLKILYLKTMNIRKDNFFYHIYLCPMIQ